MYRKFCEVWTWHFWDMQADRQTYRHDVHNTSHPSWGDVKTEIVTNYFQSSLDLLSLSLPSQVSKHWRELKPLASTWESHSLALCFHDPPTESWGKGNHTIYTSMYPSHSNIKTDNHFMWITEVNLSQLASPVQSWRILLQQFYWPHAPADGY